MKLIYLKEGRSYTPEDLAKCFKDQMPSEETTNRVSSDGSGWVSPEILERLREAVQSDFGKSAVRGENGRFIFRYIGLYDFIDSVTGKNLTLFFIPKFIDFQRRSDSSLVDDSEEEQETMGSADSNSWKERIGAFGESERNAVLLAIDRYNRELNTLAVETECVKTKRESVLELAVRVLRDYLENGVYTVRRRELEHNGQGEIDWDTTIDQYQPVFQKGRPAYMDMATELALSDENHYITRLHQCLVTTWGRKLEKLGLSSVLRVNVPLLSEEELDHFGDDAFKIAQIDKELNVQFVTKSRTTLSLMKDLIRRSSENETANHQSLSFGMNGAEHLWETACASVLGSELDKGIAECRLSWRSDETFREYMPRPLWARIGTGETSTAEDQSAYNETSGWRLDFIRTWPPKEQVTHLVILDAKYYDVVWKKGLISGQPGIGDIAKQIFYQMAFKDLAGEHIGFVNAFLFPEDDCRLNTAVVSERVRLGWTDKALASAFADVKLFAIRLPGIEMLRRYAHFERAEDWFSTIFHGCHPIC